MTPLGIKNFLGSGRGFFRFISYFSVTRQIPLFCGDRSKIVLQYANKALLMLPDKSSIFGDTKTVITEEKLKNAFGISVFIGTEQIANDNYRYIIPLYKQHE